MRVRGLKRVKAAEETKKTEVAPHAGAWIETEYRETGIVTKRSHPMRVRGLKPVVSVVLLVPLCRTPCGCVD